jgi:hypothetical protein
MDSANPKTAATRLKKITTASDGCHRLSSGFHHVLSELRMGKTPLHGGMGWIKVAP